MLTLLSMFIIKQSLITPNISMHVLQNGKSVANQLAGSMKVNTNRQVLTCQPSERFRQILFPSINPAIQYTKYTTCTLSANAWGCNNIVMVIIIIMNNYNNYYYYIIIIPRPRTVCGRDTVVINYCNNYVSQCCAGVLQYLNS